MNYIRTAPLLNRRHILRGLGAMLPLPFLEAMMPGSARAAQTLGAAGKPPVRLGLWLFPGGRVRSTWELGYDTGELKELSPILKPFDPVKQHMLVLSNLSNKGKRADGSISFNGHETCNYQFLTCAGGWTAKGVNTGRSFDQIAAEALQQETFLSSLEISTEVYKEGLRIWRTPDTPVTPETNLREAYERMFKGRPPKVPQWHTGGAQIRQEVQKTARKETLQRSVIDLVIDDAKALRNKLGAVDASRLDQYLESVRGFERQLDFAERQGATFAKPRLGSVATADPIQIEFKKYSETPKNSQTLEEHRMNSELMSDLMLLAFQTDTTRVCSLDISFGLKSYADLCTGPDTDFHPLQHIAGARDEASAQGIIQRDLKSGGADSGGKSAYQHAVDSCTNIAAFYAGVASKMVQKAAELPEAGGSLLDNCLIMYSSYMATGGHNTNDYGVALFGGGGGTVKTGRHIKCDDDAPMAALYAEMLTRAGVDPKEIIEVDQRTSPGTAKYKISGLS